MLVGITTALPNFEVARSSTLTRVVWSLDGKSVIRGTWPVLDRAQDTEIRVFRLLNDVDQLTLEPVPDTGETVFNETDAFDGAGDKNSGLVKMEIVLDDGSLYSKVLGLHGDY
jgi:hypothetical protein